MTRDDVEQPVPRTGTWTTREVTRRTLRRDVGAAPEQVDLIAVIVEQAKSSARRAWLFAFLMGFICLLAVSLMLDREFGITGLGMTARTGSEAPKSAN